MSDFYNKYPYTDFHELNLDWVLKTVKDDKERLDETVSDYTQFKQDITEQQETFEGDMTRWKDGVDTDLADWKRDTNNDLDRWKTDTHNDFQGQIDDMDHAWDDFLDNYSRTFGILNSYGSSTVDAISQAKATDIKNKIDELIMYHLSDYLMDGEFEQGSYASDGSPVNATYRIRTRDVISKSYPITLVPKTGWRISLNLYSSGVWTENVAFTTDPYELSAGQEFTLVIARTTEDISENAHIYEFIGGINAQSLTAPAIKMENVENAINKFIPKDSRFALGAMDFSRGSLASDGSYNSLVPYRICNPNILQYDDAMNIICNEGNFSTSIAYFDASDNLTNYIPFSPDDKYVAPGQKFRLCIRRNVEDISEMANNRVYLAGIKVTVLSAPYVPLSSLMNVNGKIINFLGDSYVANHNDSFSSSWCYKFASKHKMVGRNYGANGTSITPSSDGGTNGSISERAAVMASADYIVVIGGKNDYNLQIPLATFKTAVENLIIYLVTNFMPSQICFFTPWKVSEQTEVDVGNTAQTIPLFDYIDTIKEVCAEYGVACYDTANSGIYTWSAGFRHTYFQGDNDISHLNSDGHDLFLPRAEKFLMTVLQ